ncbi:MAG: CSLREA domain-containing protein [Xanthomonadales bacterium]|nr:CSLREA domain-containing protein [Xanthomonadales bacterium]
MKPLLASLFQPARHGLHALLVAALVASGPTLAATILVNSAGDDNINGDGACSLREAVENANYDYGARIDCVAGTVGMDVIEIAPGLGTMQLAQGEIVIKRTLRIVGPAGRQEISGGNSSRIFHADFTLQTPGLAHELRFENLLLRDGRAIALPIGCGGAIRLHDANIIVTSRVIIDNLAFTENVAGDSAGRGGAVCAEDVDELTIRNSHFDSNRAYNTGAAGQYATGGAVWMLDGDSLRIENSQFEGNVAEGSNAEAGALWVQNVGSFTLAHSTLRGNGTTLTPSASAVLLYDVAQSWVSDSLLDSNGNRDGAGNPRDDASVFRATAGSGALSVSNTWFKNNRGTALRPGRELYLSNSTISGGVATGASAITTVVTQRIEIGSSSIVNNLGGFAAIDALDTPIRIENSTIAHNVATDVGEPGGLRVHNAWGWLRSTLITDNAGAAGNALASGTDPRLYADYSQFGDPAGEIYAGGHNLFHNDGGLGILADYGCATKVGASLFEAPVCVQLRALNGNSPALDRGDDYGHAYDQRGSGFAREVAPAVNVADIGAYEYQVPQITIEAVDASRVEGNGGTTAFSFRVLRSGDTRVPSSVGWLPEGHGTHQADAGDFPPTTWAGGTVHFAIGQTEATLLIHVNGDSSAENTEGFAVSLGTPTNGRLGSASTATGQIINDDSFFPSAVLSLTRLEGDRNEGQYFSTKHRFRVTRAQVTTGICSFQLEVLAGSGPFAPDAADFVGWTPGVPMTYVMLPGATQWDIDVDVAGDSALEFDETFDLRLQNASGCGIDTNANQVSSTIRNDDSSLWIEAVTASAPEGHAGSTPFSMMLRRGSSDLHPATVTWTVSGTGANPASAADFSGGVFPSGTTTFAAGQSEMLMVISVAGDTGNEPDEGFRVTLSNPSGGDIYPTGHVDATIVNDDAIGANEIFKNSFE